MALSNIFREPRREITESVVGLVTTVVVFGGFFWTDWQFALWFSDGDTPDNHVEHMVVRMIWGVFIFLMGVYSS